MNSQKNRDIRQLEKALAVRRFFFKKIVLCLKRSVTLKKRYQLQSKLIVHGSQSE